MKMLDVIDFFLRAPEPGVPPTSVTVPTGTSFFSHIDWGVVGACVFIAIAIVALWKSLPKWLAVVVMLAVLISAGVFTANSSIFGG